MKRIDVSLHTSNAPASLLPPPSKVAATETVQPFNFGSFTGARALGASGFESVAVLEPVGEKVEFGEALVVLSPALLLRRRADVES